METESALPLTKEILGEHLFSKVESSHPESADRITGMLLEAGNEQVMAMLEDDNLLAMCIKSALKVIHRECEDTGSIDKQTLGEELYSLVLDLKPNQCAAKITGMLMELDISTIQNLLDSPTDLQKAVNKAVHTLNIDEAGNTCGKVTDKEEEKQEIGEELYNLVALQQRELAPKITGMLLEMSVQDLRELLQQPDMLKKKVDLAMKVLQQEKIISSAPS
ncbi:uncharacterized protein [Amphiura filiformis]|uniref:uncharacterized protein n=1 Tax=Amphiura filiformis TaxID=82378 RepID=UPI003B228CB8